MLQKLSQLFNHFFPPKEATRHYLILANFVLGGLLVFLGNANLLPPQKEEFFFLCLLLFAFSLYRPLWAFWFFCGAIILENNTVTPTDWSFSLNTYQLSAGCLFLSLPVSFLIGKNRKNLFKKLNLAPEDYLLFLIPLLALINALRFPTSPDAKKTFLILASFLLIFILVKYFIRNFSGLKQAQAFFLTSSVVVLFFGFWQNIRFARGLNSFSVMPGRPNSTFPEPDWLGLYLILILAFCCSALYYLNQKYGSRKILKVYFLCLFVYLTATITLLIISVARSAWLGASGIVIFFLFYILSGFKRKYRAWNWWLVLKLKLFLLLAIFLSLAIIHLFSLTSFPLFQRAQSLGNGEQKITVSCLSYVKLPEKITTLEELTNLGCRHINLEEISQEREQGHFVREVSRQDPNIDTRKNIYEKSQRAISENFVWGIGWENISVLLGQDERGAGLNSSNIFLETWLGGGVVSFLALVFFLLNLFLRSLRKLARRESLEETTSGLFVVLSWIGLIVFNLFNAGIMLGFFWVWLGLSSALINNKHK